LKISVAISDTAKLDLSGILTIKADDKVVYTSESINKTTIPFTELDIPIDNCNLLTLEYTGSSNYIDCIISSAEVYN